jgi:methyl-accepting chemotaxis protein
MTFGEVERAIEYILQLEAQFAVNQQEAQKEMREMREEMRQGMREMREGIHEMREGMQEMREGMREMREGMQEMREGIQATREDIQTFARAALDLVTVERDTRHRVAQVEESVIYLRQVVEELRNRR